MDGRTQIGQSGLVLKTLPSVQKLTVPSSPAALHSKYLGWQVLQAGNNPPLVQVSESRQPDDGVESPPPPDGVEGPSSHRTVHVASSEQSPSWISKLLFTGHVKCKVSSGVPFSSQ